jgi:hypothetical protein
MQPWERRAFAETSFKRLFWLGYNGRFGLFSWPTEFVERWDWPAGLGVLKDPNNYNRSEVQAWKSGKELQKLLKNLSSESKYSGNIKVFAHSMGNIVVSEALKELSKVSGSKGTISHYAACQAASVAHAYNPDAPLGSSLTYDLNPLPGGPDLYSVYPYHDAKCIGFNYFDNLSRGNIPNRAVGSIINMYSGKDSALDDIPWSASQASNPHESFGYDTSTGQYKEWVNGSNPPYISAELKVDKDYDKIFAHICMARSNALGRESNLTGNVIDKEVNLADDNLCGFTGSDADHSAQFLSYFANRRIFWLTLAKKLKLKIESK